MSEADDRLHDRLLKAQMAASQAHTLALQLIQVCSELTTTDAPTRELLTAIEDLSDLFKQKALEVYEMLIRLQPGDAAKPVA